ncbi:hypothetical protein F5Y04DRAFT_255484 [Hypomontagnella monticulosa]|nr:hypothetical protein F5Y04DRAFT_255484 [Hypomontagnella monticulosa]
MARTKQTARRYGKPITTWTRFYLPLDQEWPSWPATYQDTHVGPLASVNGEALLGRMVENPEQAAYIIIWRTLEDLKNFQASPACAEFLQNLPQHDGSQVSIESGSALRYLTLDNASSSSSASPSSSRFLTLKHVSERPTSDVEGRVTLTAFMIPRKDESEKWTWYEKIKDVLHRHLPLIRIRCTYGWPYLTVWFWVLAEDGWAEERFGRPEQTQEDVHGRTILCSFRLWPSSGNASPMHEDDPTKEPQVRNSWGRAVAEVMPPVTAWVQERWDIRMVPRYEPPVEVDPEDLEFEQQLKEFCEDFRQRNESAE